jgi:hypothetical protein
MTRTDQNLFYQIARAPTGPHSRTEPKARFDSFDAAAAEARQLASTTGAAFVVMGVLATVQPADTRTGNLFGQGAA